MVYKWRDGCSYAKKADPEKVAKEINGGDITTEEAWEIAKHPKSELHKCVTWDSDRAAKAYQLVEIRSVLNHLVTVTIIKNKKGERSEVLMPYLESVPAPDGKRHYVIAHEMEEDDLNYIIEQKARIVTSISVELSVYRGRRKSMDPALTKLNEARKLMLKAETEKDTKGKPKAHRALMAAVVS